MRREAALVYVCVCVCALGLLLTGCPTDSPGGNTNDTNGNDGGGQVEGLCGNGEGAPNYVDMGCYEFTP